MYIKAKVVAGSKAESLVKESDERFIVHVKEPAKRNLANTRIRELIAMHYKVSVGKVRIINGHHSPSKLLVVDEE